MKTVWTATLLMIAAAAQAQDKVTLKWKYNKGEQLRYEMAQSTKTGGNGFDITQESRITMLQEIKEVAEGVATLQVTYERVVQKMTGPMESEFDSDKDKEPKEASQKIFASLVKKAFTVKIKESGEVVEVAGFEKIVEAMMKDLGDELGPMQDTLKNMFSNDKMKQMLQQAFQSLPKDAVGKTDTWKSEQSMELPMIGKLSTKNSHTLKDILEGGKKAVIGTESKIEHVEDDKGGMGVKISDASGKSELTWDVEKGRMESVKGTTLMKIGMGGMEMNSETTTEMKLLPTVKKEIPTDK